VVVVHHGHEACLAAQAADRLACEGRRIRIVHGFVRARAQIEVHVDLEALAESARLGIRGEKTLREQHESIGGAPEMGSRLAFRRLVAVPGRRMVVPVRPGGRRFRGNVPVTPRFMGGAAVVRMRFRGNVPALPWCSVCAGGGETHFRGNVLVTRLRMV
jgi:hypothetical protein